MRKSYLIYLSTVLTFCLSVRLQAQNVSATWGNNASTAWYTTGNWVGGAYAGSQGAAASNTNIATFNSGQTGNPIGINMGTASLNLGAIHIDNTRTTALNITNSSGTAGVLRLYGATVNSVSNVIVRNNGTGLLTLQTTNTMGIVLSNATDNIINIDNTGGITVASIISGSNKLTKAGSGSGILTLSGTNTFTGGTVVTGGTLQFGSATCLADAGTVTLNGGTIKTGATTGFGETMGTLALTDNSTFTFGTGSHSVTFAASNAVTWTAGKVLTINSWSGTIGAGTTGTAGKLFVGSNASGLTATQLAQIKFTISGVDYPAMQLSTGEVVPTLKYVITNISPATPTASSGFDVTVQSQDYNGTARNVVTTTSAFALTTNGNAGTIGGTTTGSITNGTNSTTVTGVTLSSAGTGATITATRTSGDQLLAGTSATFNVISGSTPSLLATSLSAFGSVCTNTTAGPNSFSLTGSNLDGSDVVLGPLAGFTFSSTAGGSYTSTLTLTAYNGSSTDVFVKFTPTLVQSYSGNIPAAGGGVTNYDIPASGSGINTAPSMTTGSSSGVTAVAATLAGTISSTGCTAISAYGIEYSTSNGFANGTGTQSTGSNLAGSDYSVILSGLSANTTYYYKAYSTNTGGTSYGTQQNFTTSSLSAPTATAASSILHNGFTANWNTLSGATSYRLDVSTNSNFGATGTITSETFENALSLFTVTSGTAEYFSGTSGTGDRPASSTYTTQGSFSLGKTLGTLVIESSNINTSSSPSAQFSFRLASFSFGSTGNGADVGDIVTVEVSPDGGTTYYSTARVLGNSNAYWAYDATGIASTAYDGNASPVDFQPAAGGSRTTDGYSTVTITSLPQAANMRIRITLLNNAASERWAIDDLTLTGFVPSMVSGYDNLTVNGTSQAVTGLTASTTYYYRVRGFSANSTSANSNTITTATYRDPATADFRTKVSGNYNSASTWEYNSEGSNYTDAPVPPTSGNVTVQAGHTLTFDAAFTLASGKTLDIKEGAEITVNNGITVNLNGQSVYVRSTSSNTGRIGKINGTLSNGTNVTVERYFANHRAWRLITAPFSSTGSIWANWQNSGGSTANIGTLITGPSPSGTNGLDTSPQNTVSLYSFNLAGNSWTSITDTKNTNVSANPGYLIFIRGDRSASNLTVGTSTFTTLSANGTIKTGNQAFTTSSSNEGYALIGNPYASPIDFNAAYIDATNAGPSDDSTNTNIQRKFYVLDPTIGDRGAYVALSDDDRDGSYDKSNGTSNQTKDIQSGQAFFVQTRVTGAGAAQFTLKEAHKSANNVNDVLRNGTQREKLSLVLNRVNTDGSLLTTDGALAIFDNTLSASSDAADADKFTNMDENLSFKQSGRLFSIMGTPLADNNDTVFINIASMKQRNYQLNIDPSNFNAPGLTAYIEDAFTGTSTAVSLSASTVYSFSVTSTAATSAANRFRIVFKNNTPLPVSSVNVKAYEKNNVIQVEWSVATESNINRYEVEESNDAMNFTKARVQLPKANNNAAASYSWLDNNVTIGANYYRIKSYGNNGEIKLSSIVKVNVGKSQTGISIYPNPVRGGAFNLQLSNMEAGRYAIEIFNAAGQKLMTRSFDHTGGSATQSFVLEPQLSPGVYQLVIQTARGERTVQPIIINN